MHGAKIWGQMARKVKRRSPGGIALIILYTKLIENAIALYCVLPKFDKCVIKLLTFAERLSII